MKIALGCDHGGIVLKEAVINAITDLGYEYIDCGTMTSDSVDYPDFATKVAKMVQDKKADKGVLMCGTGIGISIAANKYKGIRCAHITDVFQAEMCAEHNNANIIALGGRVSSPEEAYLFVQKYLSTQFAGGRHQLRLDKITNIENSQFK
ncbi:MAG TPA: ribose 5-phosphate isomerase B [Clostridia bacterium]|jgi:ribose 5-phosphate isomerase B|nr:ribose 5-phosphate isomerase B [Clostridia bacterium]